VPDAAKHDQIAKVPISRKLPNKRIPRSVRSEEFAVTEDDSGGEVATNTTAN
jgi:hypothetical protein